MRRYFDTSDILCVDFRKFNIFKDLTQQEVDEIERRINIIRLRKNAIVYREGQTIGGIYIVINGVLKVFKTGYDGKEQIIRFAKVGDPVGFRSVVNDEPACTTAEPLTEATLVYIPGELIIKIFRQNPDFALTLLRITCKELGESNEFLLNLAQKTVRERLAEVLLMLMDTFDLDEEKRLRIALTREDLANMVGTATESVIRLLSEFRADKLIDLQGRYIKLLNVAQIIKVANIRI